MCIRDSIERDKLSFLLELTVFAFAFLYQCFIFDVVMTSFTVEPCPVEQTKKAINRTTKNIHPPPNKIRR